MLTFQNKNSEQIVVLLVNYTEVNVLALKGTWHEIFYLCFFCSHQTTPPRPLMHGLKPVRIWLRIRRENRQRWLHSGVNVHVTALSMCMSQRCQCSCHSGVNVHVTALSMYMSQRCQCHRCVYNNGGNDTDMQPTLANIFVNEPKHCF
jgi:hypothetical protein